MRVRLLVSVASLTVLILLGLAAYRRFRVLPLEDGPLAHSVEVVNAFAPQCSVNDPPIDRIVVLQTTSESSKVKVNTEGVQLNVLYERLTEIYKTRAERRIYIVDNSSHDSSASAVLEKMVEQVPVIDRICVIDPEHLPGWYPPRPQTIAGAS